PSARWGHHSSELQRFKPEVSPLGKQITNLQFPMILPDMILLSSVFIRVHPWLNSSVAASLPIVSLSFRTFTVGQPLSHPPPYTVRMKNIIIDRAHFGASAKPIEIPVSLTPCFSKVGPPLERTSTV